MSDLEDARHRWLEDRSRFASFGEELAQRLRDGLRKEGLWGEVTGRAKEMDSLIRKLIKKENLRLPDNGAPKRDAKPLAPR